MEASQPNNFQFQDVTATKKIFELKKRIRAVCGGTAASKTVSILVWLIDYCQSKKNKNKLVTVVSESYPHLSGGAIRDFTNIMKDRGYWDDNKWNDSQHTYTFEGNELEFKSIDTYGKAHGPRRSVLFINEANNLDYLIADQLITRTSETVWLDWNPSSEFWFYTEILGKRDDVDFITLTYLDNEALDQGTVGEIEKHRDNKNWWKVYGLGQMGDIESRIYTGWQLLDEIPFEARLERYGLDFGYTNDPSALVAIYYYNGGYILDEKIYQTRLTNHELGALLKELPRCLVKADSAEPKSIEEISQMGISVVAVTKGKDSVLQGIQFVQQQKISVTKSSTNLLHEYRNYLWETDKDGKTINEPEHKWSHCMDAVRYGMEKVSPTVEYNPKLDPMNDKDWSFS